MSDARYFAGLDVGSSKIGLTILDENGKRVWELARPLARRSLQAKGIAVQKLADVMDTTRSLFLEAGQHVSLTSVASIGVCATTPTLVFLDVDLRLVSDSAVLWLDSRRHGGSNGLETDAGLQKLAYFATFEPQLLERTRWVLDLGNYIILFLCGVLTSSLSVLSQKFAFDESKGFDLSAIGVEGIEHTIDKIPPRIVATGEIVETIRPEAARLLGLGNEVRICSAAYDSVAGLIGGGLYEPSSSLLVSLGTSVVTYMVPPCQNLNTVGRWSLRKNLLPGGYKTIAGGFEAGLQGFELVHKRLRLSCQALKRSGDLERLVIELESQLPDSVLALPFGNVRIRAPLPGICLPTVIFVDQYAPEDLANLLALRRGVTYFIRYSIEDLAAWGVPVQDVHVIGGATKSESFCRLLANACGVPVSIFGPFAASTGAALLALKSGCRLGEFEAMVRKLRRNRKVLRPDESRLSFYQKGYSRFIAHLKAELAECLAVQPWALA